MPSGWSTMVEDWPWFRGAGAYALDAYSEFLPPPLLGRKPYGYQDPLLFSDDDPNGWHVTEYEEHLELRPGMAEIAQRITNSMAHLGGGRQAHGIAKGKLTNNPYWPDSLAKHAGTLHHERYVLILPLALSRTQDDKGRVRWTLFGSSEQGPARAFWRGFFHGPKQELPGESALNFLRNLLHTAYDEPLENLRRPPQGRAAHSSLRRRRRLCKTGWPDAIVDRTAPDEKRVRQECALSPHFPPLR